eukprot:SAG22_NODE_1456_length_4385_cov_12.667289_5_plen_128_part_00
MFSLLPFYLRPCLFVRSCTPHRENPCDDCAKLLGNFSFEGEQLWRLVDRKISAPTQRAAPAATEQAAAGERAQQPQHGAAVTSAVTSGAGGHGHPVSCCAVPGLGAAAPEGPGQGTAFLLCFHCLSS